MAVLKESGSAPKPKPKVTVTPTSNASKGASAAFGGSYGAGKTAPSNKKAAKPVSNKAAGQYAAQGAVQGGGAAAAAEAEAIARWIAAVEAQNAASAPAPVDMGGNYEAPSAYTPPPPPPPPVPSVFESPAAMPQRAAVIEPPSVIRGADGLAGAPAGQTFQTIGGGPGTFGMFDRQRNARSPRQGLSVTPEMLRAAAQARMG